MTRATQRDRRKAEIIAGLVRFAETNGFHAVSMRNVAAEAGVSLRLVQYYFTDKAQLMLAALETLEAESRARWAARLAATAQPDSTRAFLETFIAEALPASRDSRLFQLAFMAFASLAATDAQLASLPILAGPSRLRAQVRDALANGQVRGEVSPVIDPGYEADRLVALTHGLGTSLLIGLTTADEALATLRRHIAPLQAQFG